MNGSSRRAWQVGHAAGHPVWWALDDDSDLFSRRAGPNFWECGDNDTSKSQCHAAIHAGASPSEPAGSGAVVDGNGRERLAWGKGKKNRARSKRGGRWRRGS